MTEKADIADLIRTIIAEHLGREISEVVDTARLGADLGADNFDGIEITMSIEEKFDIELVDGDAIGLTSTTVADVITLVRGKVAP